MKRILILFFPLVFIFNNCKKDEHPRGINIFSIQDDKKFGREMYAYVHSDTSGFEVLDSAKYPEAYAHLYRVRDKIINCGKLKYSDEFPWRATIIKNDSTLNAFATPGGYIYFYSGLIKYLDNEAQLAGVLGHECAHADLRHSTNQLTKEYGVSLLISIVTGQDPGLIAKVAAGLLTLKFSRDDEAQADEFGVIYLDATNDYDPRGVAGFFEKLDSLGQGGSVPEFLSTHPSPEHRIEAIHEKWKELGAKEGNWYPERYQEFKASLP